MTPTALDLALDLMQAKHPDNPDAPASMIRAGCAAPLAKALWDFGWRRQTATSAPGVAEPVESTPAPSTSGASAPTSAEVAPERLERRFDVRRISDPFSKHADCRYFVLDPQHDEAALNALAAYSRSARMLGRDALADDIDAWLGDLIERDLP